MTAEELRRVNYPDKCTELVRGRLVVREPAGYRHGRIVARFAKVLTDHVDTNDLGEILAAETGFTLFRDPDTVRAPDVGFVRRGRVPDPVPIPLSNANVFYELGVRHTARPATTLTIFATHQKIPFDVNFLRSMPYDLGENNAFGDVEAKALREAVTAKLEDLRELAVRSRGTRRQSAVRSPDGMKARQYRAAQDGRFRDQVQS